MKNRFYVQNNYVKDKDGVMFAVFCRSQKEAENLSDFLNRWVKE